jgi:hypothetical protein
VHGEEMSRLLCHVTAEYIAPYAFRWYPSTVTEMPSKDIYMVIGGSGFVGRRIVQQLLERGDTVSVFDIVQRHHDVPFYSGDISEQSQVSDALRKVCAAFSLPSWLFFFIHDQK